MTIDAHESAIEMQGVTKTYSLFWRYLAKRLARYFGFVPRPASGDREQRKSRMSVQALRGVSMLIPHGQTVGVIGVNGSGKSTLFRILAGMSPPTEGRVRVNGQVTAILEINTGLVPERSGRENIRYMGALYGISARDIEARMGAIVEFADIGRFIDLPVRTYSTGMRARLAFSIVSSVDPKILLIDETLAVGDSGFVQKCRRRIHELCARGSTVLIVSHSMETIREMCGRVIWLHDGVVRMDGDPAEVIEEYLVLQRELLQHSLAHRFGHRFQAKQNTPDLAVEALDGIDSHEVAKLVFQVGESLRLRARCRSTRAWSALTAHITFVRVDGVTAVDESETGIALEPGLTTIELDFGACLLGRFPYLVCWQLLDAEGILLAERQLVLALDDTVHIYRAGYHQPLQWRQSNSSKNGDCFEFSRSDIS